MPSFLSCFTSPGTETTPPRFGADRRIPDAELLLDNNGFKPGCPFCDVSVERGFSVVKSTPDLIAFRDRSPQSETHLQIIPRRHVASNVRDLRRQHLPMLYDMKDLALELVPAVRKMGFHISPASSVAHIHLHVFAGKPTWLGRIKYPVRESSGGKGWSWFVSWQQAVTILERGHTIGLGKSRSRGTSE